MTLGTAFHVLTGEAIHHFLVNVQYLLERPVHGQADERGFRDSQSCRCCGNLVESRIIKGDKFVACKALSPVFLLQSHNKNHSQRSRPLSRVRVCNTYIDVARNSRIISTSTLQCADSTRCPCRKSDAPRID